MSAELLSVAPVLVVKSVLKSAEFWREKVGFEAQLYGSPTNFAIVSRGPVKLMLAQLPFHATPPVPNWKVVGATSQAYIWVDDCAAMYEEVQQRGAPIDYTMYDTPWGTREFGIQDLDEYDITFGQVLNPH